jgi:hypothetical protein
MAQLVDSYGFREGPRKLESLPVDSTTGAIRAGDGLTQATAGFYKRAAAGEIIYAIAAASLDTAPSADGGAFISADVGNESTYEYPAGTGTLTAAMSGFNCDAAGPRSLDVTAATRKSFYIISVDLSTATALVRLNRTAAGVV